MTTRNNRIRFCENNFAELTTGQITYSSENSDFPFTNAINRFRSRVYKPTGHFKIDNTNNKIYINDIVDKTITLSNGSYATPALLAAQIQTKLNASSSNWTVAYDTLTGDYRFKISRSSSATLKLSNSTNAVWNTIGFTTSVDRVGTAFFADQQRNHSYEEIIFDFGNNLQMTFVAIIGPLNEVFSISNNAIVKLQGSNLNQWDAPPFEITLDVTDKGIMRFLDDFDDTGYRFFRIYIEDKFNPKGPDGISIGHIYLGDYSTLTNRNMTIGFEYVEYDPSLMVESEGGVLHFDTKAIYGRFEGMAIGLPAREEKALVREIFERLRTSTPFYFSVDPTLVISDDLEELTRYVVFSDSPKFRHVIRDIYSISFSLREVV